MSKIIENNREVLFLWDAKNTNPNGDMLMDNQPRYDEVSQRAEVSDVRVKRTIRDDMQYRKEMDIFLNNEEIEIYGLKAEENLTKKLEAIKKPTEEDKRRVISQFIDNRLFGVVMPDSKIQNIGAVQFGQAISLNKTEIITKQGTGAYINTKAKNGGRSQKTFRIDQYLPYALFGMYGTINKYSALKQQKNRDIEPLSDSDIEELKDSFWYGTKFLNTRSKMGQKPRAIIEVKYSKESKRFIGLLNELVTILDFENSENFRDISEIEIDFSILIERINSVNEDLEEVNIWLDESMRRYENILNEIKKVNITFKG